jgi:hypothetical protein
MVTPVIKSLCQPLAVKGCAYEIFTSSMLLAVITLVLLFACGHGFLGFAAGMLVFVAGFKAGQWITKRDPQLLSILACRMTWRNTFDGAKHRRRKCAVS